MGVELQISLAAARVNSNMRQDEAAKAIGVTAKTLRNYERGTTAIPSHVFKKAANVYNFPEKNIRLPIVDDGTFDRVFLNDTTF